MQYLWIVNQKGEILMFLNMMPESYLSGVVWCATSVTDRGDIECETIANKIQKEIQNGIS